MFTRFYKFVHFKRITDNRKPAKNLRTSQMTKSLHYNTSNSGVNTKYSSNHTVIQVEAINSDLENFHNKFGKYYTPKEADVIENQSFFRAIGPVIRFGQIFTLMPIINCLDRDLTKITFKWKSFQAYKSIFGIACSFFEYILFLRVIASSKITIEIIAANAFFATNCLAQVFLFRIAMNWNEFIQQWTEWEKIFLYLPYRSNKISLKTKIRCAAFVLLGAACTEHTLYLIQVFYTNYKKTELCGYHQSVLELIYFNLKYHFYVLFSYNEIWLFISEWINLTMAISWTFIDALIVTLSLAIATRFKQINDRVRIYYNKSVSEELWINVRDHYNKIVESVRLVDKYFGSIVLLSCANNFYFMCLNLYNSVKIEYTSIINRTYFWASFMFLFFRTMAVLFSAAHINDISGRSITIMRNIPADSWSVEAARFTEQLTFQCVAVSAHNFFAITRKFIFAMAGTIITYEIVLLDQLDIESISKFQFCNTF